jgi:hypothetical protein
LIEFIYSTLKGITRYQLVKKKKQSKKLEKKSNSKKSVSSDRILRKHLTDITGYELKKLKTDKSYKEGFLLAVKLMTSELKTIVFKK